MGNASVFLFALGLFVGFGGLFLASNGHHSTGAIVSFFGVIIAFLPVSRLI